VFLIYGENESLRMLFLIDWGFRFPIADLQPLNKRRPWWIQAVHKEILTFDLKQIHFQSDFDKDEATALTVTSESIQGKFLLDFSIKNLRFLLI
jgi:hypothetical protein